MSNTLKNATLDELLLGHGIEFAGVIGKNGRLAGSKTQNHINLSNEQNEMFFMSCSLEQRMNQNFDYY